MSKAMVNCSCLLLVSAIILPVKARQQVEDSFELQHFWLTESRNAADTPAGYSLVLESYFWPGLMVVPSYYREQTSVGGMSYCLTEYHLQLGPRVQIADWFTGILVGVFKGEELFSSRNGFEMRYSSQGLAGTLLLGYVPDTPWQFQLSASPKGFRDGLAVRAELAVEYRIEPDFRLTGSLISHMRDMTFTDHQYGVSAGLKYSF